MKRTKLTDDQLEALVDFFDGLGDDFQIFEDFIDQVRAGATWSPQELFDMKSQMTRLRSRCATVASGLAKWS